MFSRFSKVSIATFLIALSGSNVNGQQQSAKGVVSEIRNSVDNTLKTLSFSEAADWHQSQAPEIFRQYLGLTDSGPISMVLKNKTVAKSGLTVSRYTEYYKGIEVAHGSFTLAGKGDKVAFMNGNFYTPDENLSNIAVLSEAAAFGKAIEFVGADKYKWENPIEEAFIKEEYNNVDTTFKPKGKLIWVEDIRSRQKDHKLHLAYSFDIYADVPMSRQEVFVDASTGKILFSNQLIKHTAAVGGSRYSGAVPFQSSFVGGTYRLYDSTRGNGVYTRNMNNGTSYGAATQFTSATNTWPVDPDDDVALDAHWGGSMVYDYLLAQHGRLSWNGTDGQLRQYVHYDVDYNNAYWNGSSMTYGDGSGLAAGRFSPLTSLDVTAHEIGHGICQATCGLIYESESGALNEAFSDCWGATIEHWADPHEVDAMPKAPWEMGEEISTEPLRSLNAPLLQGQPNTYGGTNWFDVVGCIPVGGTGGNDNCGVHRNSGLMNYWYYLLTMGGAGTNGNGDDYIVNALGWTNAAKILYGTELALSSTAEYIDCRAVSIATANTLFGPCSPETQSVTSAWYAVGVGPDYVPCAPQIAFTRSLVRVSENAATALCPATKTINIGLKPNGPVISGGSPVANLIVTGSTALPGVDYSLSSSSVVFPAGDTSTQYVTMTIFDNGAVNDDKSIEFAFTVSPMGTGAEIAPYNDSLTIYIDNDDSVPHVGGILYPLLNEGLPVVSDFTSPFYGSQRRARSQYLLFASEMATAGVVPGQPISQIGFEVLTKNSTGAFANFTVSMKNTASPDLYGGFEGGLTQVYTGNHTTNTGLDTIDFNTGTFIWDGVSNVVVQFCYGKNGSSYSDNDMVAGVQQGAYTIGDYNTTNGGSGTGCGLGYSNGNRTVVRPVMRFKQTVSPTPIETVAPTSREVAVFTGQEVYFYDLADDKVIAGVKDADNYLSCVSAAVTQQGIGMTPASFSLINRSRKEIEIIPSLSGSITNADVTMYFDTAELGGVDPSTVYLMRTTAPTDATVSNSNSVLVTPSLIMGDDYVGFRGNFTGFGRYMLVDGTLCNDPDAFATAGGPTSFCLGGSVLLTGPTTSGVTYQWQLNGSDITGATSSNYTASLGGDYTLTVMDSGCDSVSNIVTVVLDSAYTQPITGSPAACIGFTTALSSATPGGTWMSTAPAVATVSASGIVTGISAGTTDISYTTTNACGTSSANVIVTVSAASPVAPITGTMSICDGAATTLSNATPGGTWGSSDVTTATVSSAGTVSGVAAGTVTITYGVTTPSGCVSYATATITVNPNPTPITSPSGSVVLCAGVGTTINVTPAAGHTYQWQSGGVDVPGATSSSFTTSAAGNYRVIETSAFGCPGASAPVFVTVDPSAIVVPSVSLSASSGLVICASSLAPVTYTATPVNGGGAPSYMWSVNGTTVGGPGANYTYTPADGDVIAVILTSSIPCAVPSTATASVTMTVNPFVSPAVSIIASPNDTVCEGDPVTYTAVPVNGGPSPAYLWTENGINVATGPFYVTWPHNGDIIVCHMTSDHPCLITATASSAPFVMHVDPVSVNSVTITASASGAAAGTPVTYVATAPNAGPTANYQWYVDGVAVAGANSITFTSSTIANGQVVTCEVTSSYICSLPRTVMSGGYTVSVASGVADVTNGISKLSIIPNPNNGVFTLSGSIGSMSGTELTVSVTNVLGQEVYNKTITVNGDRVEEPIVLPSNTASGIYLLSVIADGVKSVYPVSVRK